MSVPMRLMDVRRPEGSEEAWTLTAHLRGFAALRREP